MQHYNMMSSERDIIHCSISCCRLSCRIVSLTALNTKRILLVSMAVVKWWKKGLLLSRRWDSNLKSQQLN